MTKFDIDGIYNYILDITDIRIGKGLKTYFLIINYKNGVGGADDMFTFEECQTYCNLINELVK